MDGKGVRRSVTVYTAQGLIQQNGLSTGIPARIPEIGCVKLSPCSLAFEALNFGPRINRVVVALCIFLAA